MTSRYYVDNLPREGGILDLPQAEAAHANRVMRVKPGDEVILFDGKNHECRATVISQTKRDCQCDAAPAESISREPAVDVSIAVALPRGDRTRFLVERLTELGVRRIIPLSADRSQGKPRRDLVEKLTRIAIESCKQSGRNQLPTIAETRMTKDFLSEQTEDHCWIAHPLGPGTNDSLHATSRPKLPIRIAIGPEGGFTDDEVEQAIANGYRPMDLGPRIYRIETAAIVMATLAVHRGIETI